MQHNIPILPKSLTISQTPPSAIPLRRKPHLKTFICHPKQNSDPSPDHELSISPQLREKGHSP